MTTTKFLIENGWLTYAFEENENRPLITKIPSPFFNQRPQGELVRLLVVHNISVPAGNFDHRGVDKMFTGTIDPQLEPELAPFKIYEVSAHCLITRDGNIRQYVSFDDRAWHAGVSEYAGVSNCNDFSVGIELSGADDLAYTEAQYDSLAHLTNALLAYFPAMRDSIQSCSQCAFFDVAGHEHIAANRKTDPGSAFDWGYFLDKTEQLLP